MRDKLRNKIRDEPKNKAKDITYKIQSKDVIYKISDDIRQNTYTG